MDEAELIKLLLETFKIEAKEHVDIIAKGLIELEKDLDEEKKKTILEEIYRSAHSMKGASRAVNLTNIEKICQSLESCFSMMKNEELEPSAYIFDIFHSVIDTIESLLDDEDKPDIGLINKYIHILENINDYQEVLDQENTKDTSKTEKALPEEAPIPDESKTPELTKNFTTEDSNSKSDPIEEEKAEIEEEAEEVESKESIIEEEHAIPEEKPKQKSSSDTIRLSTKKIDSIYLNAEESLQIKLSHNQEVSQIKEITEDFTSIRKLWSTIYSEALREQQITEKEGESQKKSIGNLAFSAYENINESLKAVDKKFTQLLKTTRYVANNTHNILDSLVDEVKNILMVPFSNLLSGFPRIVRELSKDLNKDVEIKITGADIEVDRRIMEGLKDPLIHMIRNSIGHGIEQTQIREKLGKSPKGKLEINISQKDANHVLIEIKDDGSGIDKDKLIDKAIKNRAVTKEELSKLSEEEVIKLVFRSGISTSSIITDISGRGLGLSIVEENIEKLGGKVAIESNFKKGCKFSIEIPTTISKSQGLLIAVGKKKLIIPVSNIVETLRVKKTSLKRIENTDTIQYQNNTLPLINLADVLQINAEDIESKRFIFIVILESKSRRMGFIVSDIIHEQEVLFKSLGYPLLKVRNVAGVSILGTGELCPILNNQDLIKSTQTTFSKAVSSKDQKAKAGSKKSILIAEDSITSRLFIKNILEGAGYKVKATVDGREAFTSLKQDKFDLLVTDIEMPRMNGFELTEAVRSDKILADLPIILVSSLSRREDQEKGIDVGANAYIVKGSFEQSNLLEVIKRLI